MDKSLEVMLGLYRKTAAKEEPALTMDQLDALAQEAVLQREGVSQEPPLTMAQLESLAKEAKERREGQSIDPSLAAEATAKAELAKTKFDPEKFYGAAGLNYLQPSHAGKLKEQMLAKNKVDIANAGKNTVLAGPDEKREAAKIAKELEKGGSGGWDLKSAYSKFGETGLLNAAALAGILFLGARGAKGLHRLGQRGIRRAFKPLGMLPGYKDYQTKALRGIGTSGGFKDYKERLAALDKVVTEAAKNPQYMRAPGMNALLNEAQVLNELVAGGGGGLSSAFAKMMPKTIPGMLGLTAATGAAIKAPDILESMFGGKSRGGGNRTVIV